VIAAASLDVARGGLVQSPGVRDIGNTRAEAGVVSPLAPARPECPLCRTDEAGTATPSTASAAAGRSAFGPLASVAILLLPKCPICGATYLSLSGITALPLLPPLYWVVPALALLMVGHLVLLGVLAARRQRYAGFVASLIGAGLLLVGGLAAGHALALGGGIFFVVLGALLGTVEAGRLVSWRQAVLRHVSAVHRR
jgi:hypothetical protein